VNTGPLGGDCETATATIANSIPVMIINFVVLMVHLYFALVNCITLVLAILAL